MSDYRDDWMVVGLDRIISAWVKEYSLEDREIWNREWFVDVAQGKVVIKLSSKGKED